MLKVSTVLALLVSGMFALACSSSTPPQETKKSTTSHLEGDDDDDSSDDDDDSVAPDQDQQTSNDDAPASTDNQTNSDPASTDTGNPTSSNNNNDGLPGDDQDTWLSCGAGGTGKGTGHCSYLSYSTVGGTQIGMCDHGAFCCQISGGNVGH